MATRKKTPTKKETARGAVAAKPGKPFRILALDGGGIRGIITARWLAALEAKTKQLAREHFDLIAGTSTGSILASAVSMGIAAEDIVKLYIEKGKTIFAKPSWARWFQRIAAEGFDGPKYDGRGLEATLKEVVGDETFGSLPKKVLITAYDTAKRSPLIFKSWKIDHKQFPLWEVVKASCSAPTFFPGHKMRIDVYDAPLVDGGVVANNPAACALAEGVRLLREEGHLDLSQVKLLSLGTGELTRPITLADTQEWGKLEWAIPIIDVLFDGAGDAVDYQCRQVLGDQQYMRLQCPLIEGYDEMDNADLTNLNALLRIADKYADEKKLMDEVVKFVQ